MNRQEDIKCKELLPCPFCGGEAYIRRVCIGTGMNSTMTVPEGAEIIHTYRYTGSGRPMIKWARYGYSVHCNTPKCLCRNSIAKAKTQEDIISMWNTRA